MPSPQKDPQKTHDFNETALGVVVCERVITEKQRAASPFELIVPGVSLTSGPKLNLSTCGHEILGTKSSSFHLNLLRS